jgi:hypothetical protein
MIPSGVITSMTPPGSPSPATTSLIRPKWFIARSGGKFVPLIAVDELPEHVALREVPRELSISQLARMECLGEFPCPETSYSLQLNRGSSNGFRNSADSGYMRGRRVTGNQSTDKVGRGPASSFSYLGSDAFFHPDANKPNAELQPVRTLMSNGNSSTMSQPLPPLKRYMEFPSKQDAQFGNQSQPEMPWRQSQEPTTSSGNHGKVRKIRLLQQW